MSSEVSPEETVCRSTNFLLSLFFYILSGSQPFLKNPDFSYPPSNENMLFLEILNSYVIAIPETLYSTVEKHYLFICL